MRRKVLSPPARRVPSTYVWLSRGGRFSLRRPFSLSCRPQLHIRSLMLVLSAVWSLRFWFRFYEWFMQIKVLLFSIVPFNENWLYKKVLFQSLYFWFCIDFLFLLLFRYICFDLFDLVLQLKLVIYTKIDFSPSSSDFLCNGSSLHYLFLVLQFFIFYFYPSIRINLIYVIFHFSPYSFNFLFSINSFLFLIFY